MDSREDDNYSGYKKSKKVYVSNINFECSVEDLRNEFSRVGEVTFVQMLKNDNKRFTGCAVVTYSDAKTANRAIDTMNRAEFHGRKLVVKEEEANPISRQQRKRPHMDNSMDPPNLSSVVGDVDQNTFGLSMPFLKSLYIDLPLITTVFVANLGYDVTEKMLKEVFQLAGNVITCEIFKDKDGGSRGFGIVEYEHPVEAVQAISMLHNQEYKDRTLAVRMDRSDKRRESKVRLPVGLKSVGMGLGMDGNALKSKDVKSVPDIQTPRPLMPDLSSMDSLGGGLISSTPQNSFGGSLLDSISNRMALGAPVMSDIAPRSLDSVSAFPSPGTLGNIIRITNLPLDYTSEDLRKLIWNYGDVMIAEMRSKGSGIVKMRTSRDAQRAVQMLDRQPMSGRLLSVLLL